MAVDLMIAWGAEELYDMCGKQGTFYLGQGCYCWLKATATKRWVQLPEEQLHCIKWTQGLCSSTLSATTGTEKHTCLKIQFLAFAAELLLPLTPTFLNLNIKTKVISIRRKWTAHVFPTRTGKLLESELKGRTCSRKPLTIQMKETAQLLLWEKLCTGKDSGEDAWKKRREKWWIQRSLLPSLEVFKCDWRERAS